jgi:hypothetical protein
MVKSRERRMRQARWSITGFIILLALTALSCDLSELSREPPLPTPAPVIDTIVFNVPFYSTPLEPGGSVPGTRLHYVGRRDDGYEVTIDGLATIKRAGDSFTWSGILAPGVFARYQLRLAPTILGRLVAAGQVELAVLYPNPVEMTRVEVGSTPYYFDNVPVQYLVPVGSAIPGTTITYQGETEQGSWFTGMAGHPYRLAGDSLIWIGRLRDNVTIRYNLRVVRAERNGVRLAGTIEIWIMPRPPLAAP